MGFVHKHYKQRLLRLKKRLRRSDVDYAITTDPARLRYLVGYTGSNGLLVLGNGSADFFTDGRYREQAKREVRGARSHIVQGDLVAQLARFSELKTGHPKIGYEPHLMTARSAANLRRALPNGLFVALDQMVSSLLEIKDADEIACIRRAAKIADDAFDMILTVMRAGMTEREVAAELEHHMMRAGSEKTAFETIVASGHRSALPHGLASSKRIQKGDFVTLDYGATVKGYVSDITRTVIVGRASARQKRVYDLVLRAQEAALRKARAGVACSEVDRAARQVIQRAGHLKRFDHGLGHGIGLVVHEGPSLNARSQATLRSGMVVTIEPGVYFPGWGGVRIEDDVVIRPRSCTVLTHASKTLIEI